MIEVQLVVNGAPRTVRSRADRRLVDTLRDEIGLDDTRVSCEDGVCGVCTVIVDGRLTSACLTLTAQADRAEVWTAAGLAERPALAELRAALEAEGGIQCGFCTNGQFVTAAALVDGDLFDQHNPDGRSTDGMDGHGTDGHGDERRHDATHDHNDVVEHMNGTLCRCTGYHGILRAVERARR